jgi:hypothetical protein
VTARQGWRAVSGTVIIDENRRCGEPGVHTLELSFPPRDGATTPIAPSGPPPAPTTPAVEPPASATPSAPAAPTPPGTPTAAPAGEAPSVPSVPAPGAASFGGASAN